MILALRYRVIEKRNFHGSMEMSFLSHALLQRIDAYKRNMGMSFFVVCPLRNCECKAQKIGMNCNQSLAILFPFDSSRFSGQRSRIYTGIPKKDISMFHEKKDLFMLFPYPVSQE